MGTSIDKALLGFSAALIILITGLSSTALCATPDGTTPQALQQKCDSRDAASCFQAGETYARGLMGVQKDYALAAQLYKKACRAKYKIACDRFVAVGGAGFKAIDNNSGLQDWLNASMGVVLQGPGGAKISGKLAKVPGKGLMLYGNSASWVHLDSTDIAGLWEAPGPTAVPLLVTLINTQEACDSDNACGTAVSILAGSCGPDGTAALVQIAANHKSLSVRKFADWVLNLGTRKH